MCYPDLKMEQWMLNHPEYRSNQMYVGGDSYSGIVVPLVLQHILDGARPHLATFIIGGSLFFLSLMQSSDFPTVWGPEVGWFSRKY